jgi:hypothetical protein
MYNVNETVYTLNSKLVLSVVDQQAVLEYFLNTSIKLKKQVISPIRNDNNPSCSYNLDSDGNLILFDYARGSSHTIIDIIKIYLNIDYKETLRLIQDKFIFNTSFKNLKKVIKEKESFIYTPPKFELFVNKVEFQEEDYNLFDYIDREKIKDYPITKVDAYKLNGKDYFHVAYVFNHKNFTQIYRPDLDKNERYRANTNYGLHDFNYKYEKPYSITTKSVNDALVVDNLGINTRFVLNEGHTFTEEEIVSYNSASKNILLYDNDEAGYKAVEKVMKNTNDFFIPVFYPKENGIKDSKDYIRFNKQELITFQKNTINGLIKNI